MKAVFRCDASGRIGAGHVVRCLSLASALAEFGTTSHFVCRQETLSTVPDLSASGHEVIIRPSDEPIDVEMLSEVFPLGCDILIVDHYELDASWETTCQGWARIILVIDDLTNRAHDCDFLLDSAADENDNSYADLTPSHCKLLLGPEYALLRPEFARLRDKEQKSRLTTDIRIFIMFGGVDALCLAPQAVEAVLEAKADGDIYCDLVSGPLARSLPNLKELAANSGDRIRLHVATPEVATLMAKADIAIGAAGSASWERCCLGLPTISVCTVENQRQIAERLAATGAARLLGTAEGLDKDTFRLALQELIDAPDKRQEMAAAASALCDGHGARRTGELIRNIL